MGPANQIKGLVDELPVDGGAVTGRKRPDRKLLNAVHVATPPPFIEPDMPRRYESGAEQQALLEAIPVEVGCVLDLADT